MARSEAEALLLVVSPLRCNLRQVLARLRTVVVVVDMQLLASNWLDNLSLYVDLLI